MPAMRPDPPPVRGEVRAEIDAMVAAYEAICPLDDPAQERVLNWLTSRLGAEWVKRHAAREYADEEPPF